MLIGWVPPEVAVLLQSGRLDDHPRKAEFELRAQQARIVAGARRPVITADGVVSEAPRALRDYVGTLADELRSEQLEADGWRLGLVDLRRVCAVQPHVFVDTELPDVAPEDLEALARITLQPVTDLSFDIQFHNDRQAWVASAGPHFKIVREFHSLIEPGIVGFGFAVQKFGSFLQVVRYQDRYVIRDGNHRALAFLARGINTVPALVSEAMSVEDIHLRRGMLSIDVVLGPRAPLLPDYLDNDVSTEVHLAREGRVIIIQGMEIPVFR